MLYITGGGADVVLVVALRLVVVVVHTGLTNVFAYSFPTACKFILVRPVVVQYYCRSSLLDLVVLDLVDI